MEGEINSISTGQGRGLLIIRRHGGKLWGAGVDSVGRTGAESAAGGTAKGSSSLSW